MYKVARFLLAIAVLEFGFCVAVVMAQWWPWPMLIMVAILALRGIERGRLLFAYGTARWAGEDELRQAGMIGGNKGLMIGRLMESETAPWRSSLGSLFESTVSDKGACEQVITRICQSVFRKKAETVRLAQAVHTVVFGPTGMGKGSSFIVPWLLDSASNQSAVVLDFKGELATITSRHRERVLGQRVVLLDPFHVVTTNPDCFNPIDFIAKDSANVIDDCRDLAQQLVVRTGEEREPHWNDAAESFISAAIAAVVQSASSENRSLQTVRDVLSNPDKIPQLIELLCNAGGMYGRLGGQLSFFRDKELSSTLTTTNRHLRFLDTPAISSSTRSSSFDPRDLRKGNMTIYCILPPEHMKAQAALLRMWVGGLMRAVIQGGLQHD